MLKRFGHFGSCLRVNLAFLLFVGVICGTLQTAFLLAHNGILPFQYPHLTLSLLDRTFTTDLYIALALAVLLSFLFGFRKKTDLDPSSLMFMETILIVFSVSTLIVLKKYFSTILSGPFAYYVFYISHWVKENWAVVGLALSLIAGLIVLVRKQKKAANFFSLKLAVGSLAVFLLVKGIAFASSYAAQSKLMSQEAPNVILLTVDTLRADHLSSYGYHRNTSPSLDGLAKESAVFKNAMTAYTKTNQSFSAMLSGKHTYATGVGKAQGAFVPTRNMMLAEILKNTGYQTVGIISNPNLMRLFNYDNGFDEYFEMWYKKKGPVREHSWYTGAQVTERGTAWLEKNHSKKFFMWIHYIDPHTPYSPPPPYDDLFKKDAYSDQYENVPLEKISRSSRLGREEDPDVYIALHDAEIRFVDEQIRIFLEKIKALDLDKNTLLIFTADHGESLTEHGFYFDHGKYTYETCAHVPMMIRYPKLIPSARVVDEPVSTVDVVPTILDFVHAPMSADMQGHSLKEAALTGRGDRNKYIFIESDDQSAIRTNDWKLIHRQDDAVIAYELYDLKNDPAETVNLIGKDLSVERELMEVLRFWRGRAEKRAVLAGKHADEKDMDPDTLEQLKSLGYIG